MLFGILSFASLAVSVVCAIIVLVALFKKEGVGLGILGLFCGIYTYIWGWMKSTELGLKKTMILWTVSMILYGVFAGMAAKAMMENPEFQKQFQQQMDEAQRKAGEQQGSVPAPVTPEPAPAPAPQ